MKVKQYSIFWMMALAFAFGSCKKALTESGYVYPPANKAAVKFDEDRPEPTVGNPGTIVTFAVNGLNGKQGQFKFYFNGMEAEVVSVAENTVTAKVPASASTGNVSVELGGEFFYGPRFPINGKVSISADFNASANKSEGPILDITQNPDGNFILSGGFISYASVRSVTQNNIIKPIKRLALIDKTGTFNNSSIFFGGAEEGLNGVVNDVKILPDNRYLISGSFSAADTVGDFGGIARFATNKEIEIANFRVANNDEFEYPGRSFIRLSTINGGAENGFPEASFVTASGSYILVGNFAGYSNIFADGSTYNSLQYDKIRSRQIMKISSAGVFDSTFNFNKTTNQSYNATNGVINDAIQLSNGNIVIIGNFTTFQDKNGTYPAGGIVMIDTAGLYVPRFNSGGIGADKAVSGIQYNETTKKIMITGVFSTYNGVSTRNVAMLNENGTLDLSFKAQPFDSFINFAYQLKNGKILVSGSFIKYNGIVRNGFAILNPDGTLAANYNNTGYFSGIIWDAIETTTNLGTPAVLLVGSFNRFDGQEVGNIVKVQIDN